jgi:ribosome-associated translation inhibitor RaiA
METTITARRVEIPAELRARAESSVERLGFLASRPVKATVVFGMDGIDSTAELRMHLSHGELLVASGAGPDHRTALDRAEERLRRQVGRDSGRFRAGRHTNSAPL